jgi:nucleotide-binding universal stress UspA family protein
MKMPSFKHILFPVDFSQQNCNVAPYVMCMARRYGAHVSMLHVIELPTGAYPGWPAQAALVDYQSMRDERKQRLDTYLKTEFQEVATTRLMCEGDPAHAIADYAQKEHVDLIMMPTHGYGPFRRFLLGSVTAKVLHDVKCPVWTSSHVPEAPAPPSGYRHVLCAVDFTPKSAPLMVWASRFAREQGATLKLVHAIPAAQPPDGIDIEGGKFRAFLMEVAREELAKLQREAGTELEAIVEGGDVSPVVRRAAEDISADLVVIGRGVMQELFGRMRTHVYSVIRETPCPVISV